MKRLLWLIPTVTAVLFSYGCKEAEPEIIPNRTDGTVTFVIGNDAASTKAPQQVASWNLGMEGLSLVETVSDMDGLSAETKGVPVYTENFDSLYGTSLYATAYVPESGTGVLSDVWGSFLENGGTVRLNNCGANKYSYNYSSGSTNLSWPAGEKLLYFLQAPYSVTGALSPLFFADGRIEFDYTDPVAPVAVGGRRVITDPAVQQSDILFTSKEIHRPEPSAEAERLLMYHALTAVKFRVGNQDDEVETIIRKVTFKGIKANGHCTVTPDLSAGVKSSACALWTQHGSEEELIVDYTQSFHGTVDFTRDNSSFGDSFYNGTNLRNLGAADGSMILMMVPQELKDVEVEVEYSLRKTGSFDVVNYKRAVRMSSLWKAGEIHTYTLTVNTVDVRIDDEMNSAGTVKSDVRAQNTGNVTAYLRAAYVLAWYYGHGDDAVAVAPYHGDGVFENLGGGTVSGGAAWIHGSDGYWYYRYPVLPGNMAEVSLFSSYTAPGAAPPFAGAHLEMKMLLQGVQYDADKTRVGSAWGDAMTLDASGNPTTVTIVSQLSAVPEQGTI